MRLNRIVGSVLLSAFCLYSSGSLAGSIDCGHSALSYIYVQGDRSDGSFHGNKLLIVMGPEKKPECSDITFAYLENSDEAYNGILSMAMTAFTSGKNLRVVVNDGPIQGNARRIEWVNF